MTIDTSDLKLTAREAMYLEVLQEHTEGVSREDLSSLRPEAPTYSSNLVDVHVMNLRKKLAAAGYGIQAVRGYGYRIIRV